MCSILGILDIKTEPASLRERALKLSKLQRHRGPDWSGVYSSERAILVHERLAIVDVSSGAQPLYNEGRTHVLAVNGEIYNHKELEAGLHGPYRFRTASDCEVILPLYAERGADFFDDLNGIFALVLYDSERDRYVISRDHIGIVPLYTGRDEHGNLYVASEMKALIPACRTVEEFPPGHVLDSEVGVPRPYYHRRWRAYSRVKNTRADLTTLRHKLECAVRRQLMSDVPYGVLLSGGLDSSIIASTARRYARRRVEDDGRSEAWWPALHTFAIGLEDSSDLSAAREVAEHIGAIHHEFHFTIQEGFDALPDTVYHLETYDVTTIRAATPMFLMARRIRAMGVKMVLSGEGADEIFGGYLYFHKAPDAKAFHEETVRKLDRLHLYDCLRANKAMAAWGVEARVPFLDKEFLDYAMSVNPADKISGTTKIEKHLLREAFSGHLPDSVLWRQKEQFSDGVGYGWIDGLRELADSRVSERDLQNAQDRFPHNTPTTKEEYWYRSIFAGHFPLPSAAECVPGGPSVACSTPEALAWDPDLSAVTDPSGRAIRGVHKRSY